MSGVAALLVTIESVEINGTFEASFGEITRQDTRRMSDYGHRAVNPLPHPNNDSKICGLRAVTC
ncbi:hypothetical protein GCM10025791_21100 [Halioxenophilus aromaticivorans]|uniref:Uncharacterized protein n=1 Tax=Halioxenophilus aromaticivorans TaxID=1306992 RepID=A0AAV3U2U8_9ALTE